jgi:hypothetical protein
VNLKTIADALASVVGTVTATNGTDTESATATADLPNQVGRLALLVYPPTGTLNIVMGPRLDDQYDFPVKLLRDPLDMPARSQWLYAWATALRGRVQTSWSLGVSGVTQAQVVAMRVEPDGERYAGPSNTPGGDFFDVVELTVRVSVWELAANVGP